MGTPVASKLGILPAKPGLRGAACACWVVAAGIEAPGEARGNGGGLMGSRCGLWSVELRSRQRVETAMACRYQ